MTGNLVRNDVDGELRHYAQTQPPHFGKELSTDVVRRIDPLDLECLQDSIVTSIETDLSSHVYRIHYHAGLQPSDLPSLRKIVGTVPGLSEWRLLRLAVDLCLSLQAAHAADVPQQVLHPGRVGRLNGGFVLLPTMSGLLPPLSQMPSNSVAGWLQFIAPEVLRTRGAVKSLWPRGDIFSLGRLLWAVIDPDWKLDTRTDRFQLAETCVESSATVILSRGVDHRLLQVLNRMCSLMPEDRPDLETLGTEFARLHEELHPTHQFDAMLTRGELFESEQMLQELDSADAAGFSITRRQIHLMRADWAVAKRPPDFVLAVSELNKAESPSEFEADVQRRLGHVYALYVECPDHWKRSCEAYIRAITFSDWSADIVDEWALDLRTCSDAMVILEFSDAVPPQKRTQKLVRLRAELWMHAGEYFDAWDEVAMSLSRLGMDRELFHTARKIAQAIDPVELMMWARPHRDNPAFQAAMAIVWEVNGNLEKARESLIQAESRSS